MFGDSEGPETTLLGQTGVKDGDVDFPGKIAPFWVFYPFPLCWRVTWWLKKRFKIHLFCLDPTAESPTAPVAPTPLDMRKSPSGSPSSAGTSPLPVPTSTKPPELPVWTSTGLAPPTTLPGPSECGDDDDDDDVEMM